MSDLATIRARIDALDERLQTLLNERAACALEVAHFKRSTAQEVAYYRPEREAEVLARVLARQQGPLAPEEMVRLFREIMSACRALEEPLRIAFLGPNGTFTEAAALKHFGQAVTTKPLPTIAEVFRAVEAGDAQYGVVPVENSTEGMVNHTLDGFLNSPLQICGEIELRVHHNVLSKSTALAEVQCVYAHAQALAQCRHWLEESLPGVACHAVSSNAEAAKRAAQEVGAAALASQRAAEIYGLHVLAANIEDEPDNTTRFLVIGRHAAPPSGQDKTSLLVSTVNRPGALSRLLEPLARHGLSMTRIESRPSRRGTWDYVFFIDIEGHVQDAAVASALAELRHDAALFKILGAYPRAII